MVEEGKAEASEDARKRASSTKVKTGECGNAQSRRIAAVSAFKCKMAASLVARNTCGVFLCSEGKGASYAPKTERKQARANTVGGSLRVRTVRRETHIQDQWEPE